MSKSIVGASEKDFPIVNEVFFDWHRTISCLIRMRIEPSCEQAQVLLVRQQTCYLVVDRGRGGGARIGLTGSVALMPII